MDPADSPMLTPEDWQKARSLFDEEGQKHLWVVLHYREAMRFGIEVNSAEIARKLELQDRTVRRWIAALENRQEET